MPAPVIHIFETGDYENHIRRGRDLLKGGGIVVLPTETVYGAAGVLTHPSARPRLSALRGDGNGKPFTIHLAHRNGARRYIGEVHEYGERLMKKLWPGPVALVFDVAPAPRKQAASELNLKEGDLYEDGSITLRCPDHIIATDIIGGVTEPVVMTLADSATPSGSWSSEELAKQLDDKVDLIFDAGPSRYLKPSTILKVHPDRYEIIRQGVYDQRIIERLLRTTILFVCSGNTCRSPMAEAIARGVLARKYEVPEPELEKKGISVLSAGSFALPGARATPQAVDAVREMGADLSHHRSRPLTVELIHQADMIFAMGNSHAQAVTALVPSATEKVATLDPTGDIDDPIGGDQALYKDLAGQLKILIEKRLDNLGRV